MQMTKLQILQRAELGTAAAVWSIGISDFEFVSNFGLRASNFDDVGS
jgi:hypothetical protein